MSGVLAVISAGADPLLVWGLFARGLASIQLLALADCASQVVAFGGSRGIVRLATRGRGGGRRGSTSVDGGRAASGAIARRCERTLHGRKVIRPRLLHGGSAASALCQK